jgi:hypothetical protein
LNPTSVGFFYSPGDILPKLSWLSSSTVNNDISKEEHNHSYPSVFVTINPVSFYSQHYRTLFCNTLANSHHSNVGEKPFYYQEAADIKNTTKKILTCSTVNTANYSAQISFCQNITDSGTDTA